MRKFAILSLLLSSISFVANAQFTSVTATITDGASQTWNNGKFTATLINPSPQDQPTINGTKLTNSQMNISGTMDSTGTFTGLFASNAVIVPAGTYWSFTICPNASSQCVVQTATISGTTQNLSSALSTGIKGINFPASSISYGYSDSEVIPTPNPGGMYYNVTSGCLRIWSGSTWDCATASQFITALTTSGSSGPSSVSAGTLNIPVYAGGLNQLPVYVAAPSPNSTTGLQAIGNSATQVVNVVVNGDSFNRCSFNICGGAGSGPTVNTNREAEVVRTILQSYYGSHGTGIVPVVAGITGGIDSSAWSITGTNDTNTTCLGPEQSSTGTLVHLANSAVASFSDTRSIIYGGGNVYFATTSTSGTLTIRVDGNIVSTASASSYTTAGAVNAGCTARILTLPSFTSGSTHTVTFTSSGDNYLFGFEGTNGTSGVSVHNVSFGGAQSSSIGLSVNSQNAFTDLIPNGVQIEYLQFLTNDAAAGMLTSDFSTYLTNVVNHYQSMASAPSVIMVVSPVDVVNSVSPEAPYTAIMTGLCNSLSIPCINLQSQGQTLNSTFIGFGTSTPLSTNNWFDWTSATWPTGNAGIHPSDIGSRVEGQLVAGAIVNPNSTSSGLPFGCTGSTASISCVGSSSAVSLTSNGVGGIASLAVASTASGGAAGLAISALGSNAYGLNVWGTGNGAGLAGSLGLFDATTSHFVFNTNLSDDFCGYTPISNVAACLNSGWKILHTGDATFLTVVAEVFGATNAITGTSHGANGVVGQTFDAGSAGVLGVNAATTSASGIPVGAFIAPNITTGNMADMYVGLESISSFLDYFVHGFVNMGGVGSTSNYGWLGLGHAIGAGGSIGIGICSDGTVNFLMHPNDSCVKNGGGSIVPLITPKILYSAAGTALPTCNSGLNGTTAIVSDATAPTYMGVYTSGGAITAAVLCSFNGTIYSWLTH